MSNEIKNVKIEGAIIKFSNFSGKKGSYNPEGRRNFCVLLSDDVATDMKHMGWNIKQLLPKDPEEAPQPYIQVGVKFDGPFPPNIYIVNKNGTKTKLDEDSVDVLDFAEKQNVDLVIRPYVWEFNGKSGVKAFLKTMYVTLEEDEFADKYVNSPDSGYDFINDTTNPF